MVLEKKIMYGYEFVKVGTFHLAEEPHPVTYNGKKTTINVVLDLVDKSFAKADESVYMVCKNGNECYVGEYSYNLTERWLRKGEYIWHHMDEKIEEELRSGCNIDIWIATNPYININGKMINISKSIEQEILKDKEPPTWNKKGQLDKWAEWREIHCKKVSDIIQEIEASNT